MTNDDQSPGRPREPHWPTRSAASESAGDTREDISEFQNSSTPVEAGKDDEQYARSSAPDPDFVVMLEQFRDETPADQVFRSTDTESDAVRSDIKTIGRFEIIRQLGQGGYGVVFLARDPQLNRLVALKVPRPEVLVTASLRERFLREGQAAAALNHASAVPVFESGTAGPICYIAAAYCDGPNLQQWLDERDQPVSADQAARWLQQLADAVQHAHSRGILHRDLKPSNILLAPSDSKLGNQDSPEHMSPRVSDFGLARIADAVAADQTRSDTVLGTPSYMAPEQAAGSVRHVGPAADIYSLGAVLYFLLTRRPPIERDTPVATLQAVVAEEPIAPARLRSDVPRDLEAICLRCLEKDPARRYATASELSDDLQRFLEGEPVRARHITRWERLRRWCARNRSLAALMALLFLTLVTATLGMTVLWRQAASQSQLAERRAGQLAAKSSQLQQAIDRLFTALADSPEIRRAGAEPLRRRLLAEAQSYYQQFLTEEPDDPALRREHARTIFRLAEIHDVLGDQQMSIELARQALDELDALADQASDYERDRARYQSFLANRLFRAGEFELARDQYRQVLNAQEDLSGLSNQELQNFAIAWSDLAASELYAADTTRATAAAQRAYEIWSRPEIESSRSQTPRQIIAYAGCLRTLGQLKDMTGDVTESERYYREAVDLLEPHLQLDSVDVIDLRGMYAGCQQGLGIAVAQQDRFDEAAAHYARASDSYEQLIADYPNVFKYREEICGVWYSFAVTRYYTGEYDEAVSLVRQTIEQTRSLAEQYPDKRATMLDRCGKDHNFLYAALKRQGKLEEAQQAMQEALDLFAQVLKERPDWLETRIAQAEATGNYGNLLVEQERHDAAMEKYLAARRLIEPIHRQQPNHARARRTLVSSYTGPASMYTKLQQYDLALKQLQGALQFEVDRAMVGERIHEIWLLDRLGRYDEAAASIDRLAAQLKRDSRRAELAAKIGEIRDRHAQQEASTDEGDSYALPPSEYLAQLERHSRANTASDE
jgi:tetratricopeptide (TPR) repeat protein